MTPLNSPQFSFKIPVATGQRLPLKTIVPIFHNWIVEKKLPELLIDVADYSHVQNGPGVLLLAHEATYSIDETYGEQGLLYTRKNTAPPRSPEETIREALHSALLACELLEKEPELGAAFALTRLQFRINNRQTAPNSTSTFEVIAPLLQKVLAPLLGTESIKLVHHTDPRELFWVECNNRSTRNSEEIRHELATLDNNLPSGANSASSRPAPGLIQIT